MSRWGQVTLYGGSLKPNLYYHLSIHDGHIKVLLSSAGRELFLRSDVDGKTLPFERLDDIKGGCSCPPAVETTIAVTFIYPPS